MVREPANDLYVETNFTVQRKNFYGMGTAAGINLLLNEGFAMQTPVRWKTRLRGELLMFLALSFFLFVFLCSLSLYRNLLIGESIGATQYNYLAIQSLVLAKIIILGKFLGLGERFSDRSLILPALYKTLVFSSFIFAFAYFEHVLRGVFSGEPLAKVYQDWTNTNIVTVLGRIPIVLFVALPFFCLAEISNLIGKGTLYALFFRRTTLREALAKILEKKTR